MVPELNKSNDLNAFNLKDIHLELYTTKHIAWSRDMNADHGVTYYRKAIQGLKYIRVLFHGKQDVFLIELCESSRDEIVV